jgi:hypothetical protein
MAKVFALQKDLGARFSSVIVKEIVKLQSGSIKMDIELGNGSQLIHLFTNTIR